MDGTAWIAWIMGIITGYYIGNIEVKIRKIIRLWKELKP